MNTLFPHSVITSVLTIIAALLTTTASSQNVVETVSTPPSNSPTTIYREVMPDGRIVYTDKAIKEGKIDHTITVEPPVQGNLWTTQPGTRPKIPPKIERTQIIKAPSLSLEEKKKIADQVDSSVIRAEMLLEDARKKQADGMEPLPGERTGNVDGKTRLNEAYWERQEALAKGVAYAEGNLKRALEQQAALR
ncbi:MAG: hypothetical protein ACXWIN_07170 [Burkholderiaceae bacterium]